MKTVLGISGYFHDSSVCLIIGGQVIEFIKEEALTRIKGTNGFPIRALKLVIQRHELNNKNVDVVAFYEQPLRAWAATLHYSLKQPWKRRKLISKQLKDFWNGPIGFANELSKILALKNQKIIYVPHHLSHALSALAYFPLSIRQKPSVHFVLDGVGDGYTQSIFTNIDNEINCVYRMSYPHSMGLFYSTITDFCGFSINEGEQKLMALAAFGTPEYLDFFREDVINFNSPDFSLNMKWFAFDSDPEKSFSEELIRELGPPIKGIETRLSTNKNFQRAANIAASAQALIEECLIAIVRWGIQETGIKSISLSGGIAQNSVAISKLQNIQEINHITVPPSPGDSGAALGAANFAQMMSGNLPVLVDQLSFGSNPLKENQDLLDQFFVPIILGKTKLESVIKLLNQGEILCCFINGSEVGPRALCNRSIICSANDSQSVTRLNELIKKREGFRPLAPVMRPNVADQYFKLWYSAISNYQWMAMTVSAKETIPESYKPALHIDNSARIQILTDDTHFISKVLDSLSCDTDMLINTSFNIAGDPIVFDIIDCYVNMERMGLTYLITDQGLFKKRENVSL
jgi:carbamoyltransferase